MIGPNEILRQRDRIGGSRRCGSAVSNTITVCAGGSSRVFRNALLASSPRQSASTTIPTFIPPMEERRFTAFMNSRICSTWIRRLFDSGRTQYTSGCAPSSMRRHESQWSQLSCSLSVQFSAFASVRATASLPLPRGPVNKYAWARRPRCKLRRSCSVTGLCSWRSLKDTLHQIPNLVLDHFDGPAPIDHLDAVRLAFGQVEVALTDAIVKFQ